MSQMVLGAFKDSSQAENAIQELQSNGYDSKDISIVMQDKKEAQEMADRTGTHVGEGAATGATIGAGVGALLGLLTGIGAIAIPGIGGLLVGGPIAAALGLSGAAATTATGAITGGLAGGLIGALTGLGVPEEDARRYEETVKAGGVLVAVPVRGNDSNEAHMMLQNHGADQIRVVNMDGNKKMM